jgi:lipopolysaccharide assembly outer membrane protein LptD (OstA)
MIDFEKEQNVKLSELKSNGIYYIIRGKYDEIITYIFSKFSRENLYIGIAEEIKENKQKYYNDIIHFLGGKNIYKINENLDTHIMKYDRSIPKILEKKLYDIYKPHNEKLYEILGRKIDIWEEYYDKIKCVLNV